MFSYEYLSVAYFAALCVATLLTARRDQRARGTLAAGGVALLVWIASSQENIAARAWLAHLYLVCGYWIPALLVAPSAGPSRLEVWLVRTDAVWRPRLLDVRPWVVQALELSYLLCYVMVPTAFVITWTLGTDAAVERFWTSVLAAGFTCYGTLPWLVSRPPRLALGDRKRPRGVPRMNLVVLDRLSHQLNTFPSGHVAVSAAATLTVLAVSYPAGVALAILTCGIAAGAVAGGYHYVVDVVLGLAIAVITTGLSASFA
jgi:membrane-associated phospholipid phosphatase